MREFEEIIDKKERTMEDSKLIYEMVSTFMKEYPNMRVNDAVNDVLNMKDILFKSFNINPTRQSQESKSNQASSLSRAERRALKHNSKKSKPKQKHPKKKHK